MIGQLAILNVGTGDTKLSFDPKKPEEVKRACLVVEDMLRRGFAILVQVGTRKGEPLYQRAKGFDPKTAEYIIVGAPEEENHAEVKTPKARKEPKPRRKQARRRVPASGTSAVAVARSAGG